MRYGPAAGFLLLASLYASTASAGPLDTLIGMPDAPGVVAGGSFGPNGNDYFGDMRLQRRSPRPLADRYARVKPRPAKIDRPRPKS